MKRPYFLNKEGIKVGEIKQVFINPEIGYTKSYVSVRKPIHYFVKFHGFGVDTGILNDLVAKKTEWIVIDYKGKMGRKLFISFIDDWYLHGIPIHYS